MMSQSSAISAGEPRKFGAGLARAIPDEDLEPGGAQPGRDARADDAEADQSDVFP